MAEVEVAGLVGTRCKSPVVLLLAPLAQTIVQSWDGVCGAEVSGAGEAEVVAYGAGGEVVSFPGAAIAVDADPEVAAVVGHVAKESWPFAAVVGDEVVWWNGTGLAGCWNVWWWLGDPEVKG